MGSSSAKRVIMTAVMRDHAGGSITLFAAEMPTNFGLKPFGTFTP